MVEKRNTTIVEKDTETTSDTRSRSTHDNNRNPTTPSSPATPPRPETRTGCGTTTTGRSTPEPGPQHAHSNSNGSPHQHIPPSHQQYIDSLQPPSPREFARLRNLQEDRVRERARRNSELQRWDKVAARKSMEARRDFMHSKALMEEESRSQTQTQTQSQSRPPSQSPQARVSISHGHHDAHSHSLAQSLSRHMYGPPQVCTVSEKERASEDDGAHTNESDPVGNLRAKAATVIQRTYRGYRVRREMQGLGLDASTRWTHAIRDAQWRELNRPRARDEPVPTIFTTSDTAGDDGDGKGEGGTDTDAHGPRSRARQNWRKAVAVARRAGGDEDSDHPLSSDDSSALNSGEWERMCPNERDALRRKRRRAQMRRREHARMMGLQYFLEMVDLKHRYGSNLRTYHEEWKRSDTNDNFFYWLDFGEGKDLDLATCPRERLDRERVRYLNREERQHYLVRVDGDGRLVWAKNGVRIDTTEKWKDSIHGIVPADDPTPAYSHDIEKHIRNTEYSSSTSQHRHNSSNEPIPGSQSPSSSSPIPPSRESELEAAMAAKYANPDLDNAKGVKKVRHVSAAAIVNKLLRKSVRKNTWIFVADTSFRLYVGIKASGAFQHSSFLHGARISAAGLIKVKDGRLSSLSPLSGHYRPPASNFRAFVHSLEDEGVDMSRVSISRSYAVLFGLEVYVKTRRKGKDVLRRMRGKKTRVFAPDEKEKCREDGNDDDDDGDGGGREGLEGLSREPNDEAKKHEDGKTSVGILLQKLGIRPPTPRGQQNDTFVAVRGGRREQISTTQGAGS